MARSGLPLKSIRAVVTEGVLELSGRLLIDSNEQIDQDFGPDASQLNLSQLQQMDTADAWFLVDRQNQVAKRVTVLEIIRATSVQTQLIDTVAHNMPARDQPETRPLTTADRFEAFGQKFTSGWRIAVELISFLGQVVATLGDLGRPWAAS